MSGARHRINVMSLDFDGCIFNENYFYSNSRNRLIEHNENLIKHLTDKLATEAYDEAIFFVGSNRQDKIIDDHNSHGKGSCFPALHEFHQAVSRQSQTKMRVDPYLLADAMGDKPHGESFAAAMNPPRGYEHTMWMFDTTKLTVLYAQIHKVASEHPHAEIHFDFYDDKNEILISLSEFFKLHPDMLPENVTLGIHQYAGMNVSLIQAIQGTGKIDHHYQSTIKDMIEKSGLNYDGYCKHENNPGSISGLLLQNNGEGLTKVKDNRKFIEIDFVVDESQHPELQKLAREKQLLEAFAGEETVNSEPMKLFLASLADLQAKLDADIKAQRSNNKLPAKIESSDAVKAAIETTTFLRNLRHASTPETRMQRLQDYANATTKKIKNQKILKSIAVVALTALAAFVGILIGFGVGVAAGLPLGPLAAITGISGAAAGAPAGVMFSLAFFKKDEKIEALERLAVNAKACAIDLQCQIQLAKHDHNAGLI